MSKSKGSGRSSRAAFAEMARQSEAMLDEGVKPKETEEENNAARGEGKGTPFAPLQTHEENECCGRHLDKEMKAGRLYVVKAWDCPSCGERWEKLLVDTVEHWQFRPAFFVGRGRVRRA